MVLEDEMKTTLKIEWVDKNQWAQGLLMSELVNWVEAMIEIGRFTMGGYWEPVKEIRDPYGKMLARVK